MKLRRFEALLNRHGADLSAWAAADQEAAHVLLAASEAARQAYAEAQQLDLLFMQHREQAEPIVPADLADRIAAAAASVPQERPFAARWNAMWEETRQVLAGVFLTRLVPSMACALLIGIGIGLNLNAQDAAYTADDAFAFGVLTPQAQSGRGDEDSQEWL